MAAWSSGARWRRGSWGGRQQLGYSNEIVGEDGEGKYGLHLGEPAHLDLRQPAGALDPAEDLLDALADDLADGVPGMPGDPAIDGGLAGLAGLGDMAIDGDVGGHFLFAQGRDEVGDIIGLVGTERDPPPA